MKVLLYNAPRPVCPSNSAAVLTYLFVLELVLRHIAYGFVRHWTEPWLVLDGLIVIISVVELGFMYAGTDSTGMQALRTFRVLRVLRSLRLLTRIEALKRLLLMLLRVSVGGVNASRHVCVRPGITWQLVLVARRLL